MCWSNHQAARGSWQRETHRRDATTRADVRVSDAERDEVVEQLSRHTGDGRLTLEEFEQRVEQALNSRTRGELDATLRGLPSAVTRPARRPDLGRRLRPVAVLALVALAIVTMGAWVLWVVVPVAWCRLNGRDHHRWQELEPAEREADDLTLV